MNKRKLFRIIDLSVIGAVVLGVFGYIGISVLQSKAEHDAFEKETLDSLRDESGHIPSVIKAVAPTETSVGYTAGKKCLECGKIYEGREEIPMLTEEVYTRKVESYNGGVKVTWDIKDEYVEQYGRLSYSNEYGKGFVAVNGTNYVPYDFHKAFPGIEMSYDQETSTIIWDVTQQGGFTIQGSSFKIPTEGDNLLIKGEPLTIIAPTGSDTINVDTSSANITIDGDLDIHTANWTNISGSSSGVVAKNIIVNEGATLRVNNMKYAFYAEESITVNGEVDASGATGAVYSSGMTSKPINIAENRKAYVKEVEKTITDGKLTYGDAGKHLAICDSSKNVTDFVTYKLVGDITQPTESTVGSASFECVGCGVSKKTIELPRLNATDYEESPTPIKIDGEDTTVSSYKYNIKEFYADSIIVDKRDSLTDYINAGGYYYTATGWNKMFTKAKGTLSGKTFTISLTGDQTIAPSTEAGKEFSAPLDLTCFDKVIIKGSKKLTFNFSTVTSGLTVNELEIQSGSTVSITGKSTSSGNGLVVKKGLTVAGTLGISAYHTALSIAGSTSETASVDIASTGTLTLAAGTNGLLNSTPVNFTNEGKLTITGAKYGMNMGETNSLKFSGTSETTITSSTNCIRGQYDDYIGDRYGTDTRKDPKIRICDSAKFNATATSGAGILLFLQFIVENENGTQCDAEVNITCGGTGSAVYGLRTAEDSSSAADYTKIFILNSSKQMNILGTTTNTTKAQAGLYFRHNNVKIQMKSALHIGTFQYAIKHYNIKWSSGDIVYDNSTPMITFDNYNSSTNNFFQKEGEASGYSIKSVIYKFKNSSGSVIDLSSI